MITGTVPAALKTERAGEPEATPTMAPFDKAQSLGLKLMAAVFGLVCPAGHTISQLFALAPVMAILIVTALAVAGTPQFPLMAKFRGVVPRIGPRLTPVALRVSTRRRGGGE